MKRILAYSICFVALLSSISGCSGAKQETVQPTVNSGSLNEDYVGDPNADVVEDYMQTTEEEQLQANIIKEIEEGGSTFNGGGLSGH